MDADGRGFDMFGPELQAWLLTRDPGPAPESLRSALARIPAEESRAPGRRASLWRWTEALAGLAAVVVFAAVALTLRAAVQPASGPAASPSGGLAPAGSAWTVPFSPPILPAATVLEWLAGLGLAGMALLWLAQTIDRTHVPPRPGETGQPEPTTAIEGAGRSPLVRLARWILGPLLVATAVLAGANATGLAPVPGGPLCSAPDCPWLQVGPEEIGITVSYHSRPVGQTVWDGNMTVENQLPVPVEIDAITPIASDPGFVHAIHLVPGWYLPENQAARATGNVLPGEAALPVSLPPAASTTAAPYSIVVGLAAPRPGYFTLAGFEVDYSVGPVHFRRTLLYGVGLCTTGLPPGTICPDDGTLLR